ncbi:Uracil phosphoribosyltransferase [Hondaea fermentalgiana]|uniref:uracil phosphoribosyltransferase n=1 Tax=Hondaea fermentalgiana TaxID=2315210 RepID=A0A2R5GS60_9STRA|nr:Uracil phosphoribosyltransferase [Hondaea fermentalgiana]|eukprot:GBG30714.1 Uracil phosphoribosyltransferase [Hondaea fermentalgiana]
MASLPTTVSVVPGRAATALSAAGEICIVSIVRSGDILAEAVRRLNPAASTGKILIQRDENDPEKKAQLLYSKLPPHIKERKVVLCDPMLATGGSAIRALRVLQDAGVQPSNVTFFNVISCPQGLQALADAFPQVAIVTLAVDPGLNDDKFIVPGLGDFGDRYFGTM